MQYAEYKPGESEQSIRFAPKKEQAKIVAPDCVDFATKHSFERASVIAERRLLATAYRHSIGTKEIVLDSITDHFNNDKNIIRVKEKNQNLCTMVGVLREEQIMVNLARQGQGKMRPLLNGAPYIADKLNEQQKAAIEHVLTTSNQVSIIRGAAGTGKTTVMTEARKHIEATGKQLFVVAPTSQASRNVLVSEGFENAETAAKLLIDKDLQQKLKDQVLWVDEAGLLGTGDMTALLTLANKQNARLILGGDTRQHASVVRGDALRILNTVAGIKTAEVSKIYRQKNVHYKAAVDDLSKGKVNDAFIKLSSIGAIKNADPLKPNNLLIEDYMKAIKNGKSALIISPTHQQGEAVTDEVRKQLKANRKLGIKEITATKLKSLNLTEAEKSDWRNFRKGQVVQFSQNVPKIKRGSVWSIKEVTDKEIVLANEQEEQRVLPKDKSASYEVYLPTDLPLAKGDKVRITRNSFDEDDRRMNNGQSLKVASVSKSGKIVLVNPASKAVFKLSKDFGHIDHDYCTTSHSAQGKTVDEVFISQPSSTFTATDAKQFYVSVSRGRDAAHIYTDDRVALLEYASEIGNRQSAIELVGKQYKHIEHVQRMERAKHYEQKAATEDKQVTTPNRKRDIDYEPGI